ncbi:MAG: ParA family protein [Erysipelotrichaceae bacterium]|nr:ParA family protein [Erysipelotrichaceae bacterium]MBR2551785.1 ParA family protein [Erysipelotrichaceae bacterium]
MGKIIAVANQKGGVGKTTTCVNITAGLAYLNKKVLMVDIDPQGNATQGIGVTLNVKDPTVYDCIVNRYDAESTIKHIANPPIDVLPANINLAGADLELVKLDKGRERRLKETLEPLRDKYDFILIDCPPSLGLLNTNALTAADSILIPVQCEYYALEGVTQLLQTIRLVQRLFNRDLRIEGVLLTMFDARTKLSVEVQQEVRRHFKEKTYRTTIPRNIKLSEAPSRGKSIFDYAIRSEGAKAYVALTKEIIDNNKEVAHG